MNFKCIPNDTSKKWSWQLFDDREAPIAQSHVEYSSEALARKATERFDTVVKKAKERIRAGNPSHARYVFACEAYAQPARANGLPKIELRLGDVSEETTRLGLLDSIPSETVDTVVGDIIVHHLRGLCEGVKFSSSLGDGPQMYTKNSILTINFE